MAVVMLLLLLLLLLLLMVVVTCGEMMHGIQLILQVVIINVGLIQYAARVMGGHGGGRQIVAGGRGGQLVDRHLECWW